MALRRTLGLPGAVVTGLGSILGTGVFVALGLAAAEVGPALMIAIAAAAAVATANGLSSAQLAARHPVAGGTYEYGHRWLHPAAGFAAGWLFLIAKSASAAAAALGAASYALALVGVEDPPAIVPVAVGVVLALGTLTLFGMRRTSMVNGVIVTMTVVALAALILAATGTARAGWGAGALRMASPGPGLLTATALVFVAFTGYGRIATLGEEVRDPARTIPRAVIVTLAVAATLYAGVAWTALGVLGPETYAEATRHGMAPLQQVAQAVAGPWLSRIVAIGAVTAMLGVLLNLILGLSRIVLAMGRRGELPASFAHVSARHAVPTHATILVIVVIGGLSLLGSVAFAWSLSAATVLIYYALTNACATRLAPEERLYPAWIAWCGLAACLVLAFAVPWTVWPPAAIALLAGFAIRAAARRSRSVGQEED